MQEPLYRAYPDSDFEFTVVSGRAVKAVYDSYDNGWRMSPIEFTQTGNVVTLANAPSGEIWCRFKKDK